MLSAPAAARLLCIMARAPTDAEAAEVWAAADAIREPGDSCLDSLDSLRALAWRELDDAAAERADIEWRIATQWGVSRAEGGTE